MTIPLSAVGLLLAGLLAAIAAYWYRGRPSFVPGLTVGLLLALLSLGSVGSGVTILVVVLQGGVRAVNVSDINQLQDPASPTNFCAGSSMVYFVADGTRQSNGSHAAPAVRRVYRQAPSETRLQRRQDRTRPFLDEAIPNPVTGLVVVVHQNREYVVVGQPNALLVAPTNSPPSSSYARIPSTNSILALAAQGQRCLVATTANSSLQICELDLTANQLRPVGPALPDVRGIVSLVLGQGSQLLCAAVLQMVSGGTTLARLSGATQPTWQLQPNAVDPEHLAMGPNGPIFACKVQGTLVVTEDPSSLSPVGTQPLQAVYGIAATRTHTYLLVDDASGGALYMRPPSGGFTRQSVAIRREENPRSPIAVRQGVAFLSEGDRIWIGDTNLRSFRPTNGAVGQTVRQLHPALGHAWFAGEGTAFEPEPVEPAVELGVQLGSELWWIEEF